MPCFEVTFKGFDPNTDETDHLIKWVQAPNRGVLQQFLFDNGFAPFVADLEQMGPHADNVDLEDGMDIKIGWAGDIIRSTDGAATIPLWLAQVKDQ